MQFLNLKPTLKCSTNSIKNFWLRYTSILIDLLHFLSVWPITPCVIIFSWKKWCGSEKNWMVLNISMLLRVCCAFAARLLRVRCAFARQFCPCFHSVASAIISLMMNRKLKFNIVLSHS